MGPTASEIQGKTVQELWPSEHAEVYHQKDLELMQYEGHQVYKFELKDKTGSIRPVIFYKNVFHDEQGNVAGLIGGFVDITERIQFEQALKDTPVKRQFKIKEGAIANLLWYPAFLRSFIVPSISKGMVIVTTLSTY